MKKSELLALAERLDNQCTAPGCICGGLIRQQAAAILRKFAALEPIGVVHREAGYWSRGHFYEPGHLYVEWKDEPPQGTKLCNLTGIIDHE